MGMISVHNHKFYQCSRKDCTESSFIGSHLRILPTARATHSSTLAWKIPWMEKPGRLQYMESLRVRHDWLHFHFSLSCTGEGNGNPLHILAWRIPRREEPSGLPSMGLHRVGHDWSDLAVAAEYIMGNTGLEEAQAGIKIAGRNINNLRYEDDTTVMQKVKKN